ncbi:MAG TPA: hypothetical protein VLD62_07815 [Acidimicrobiia bacterium]|nr:hypothetical protein [Acidimicrobiia bacterium]
MDETSRALAEEMLAAYEPFVRRRLEERGIDVSDAMAAALEEGRAWLRERLESLLSVPYAQQTRSPLEVFQEAMRFPTEVLDAAGVEPPDRDAVVGNALPGDRHDLAPASSQDLGEGPWRAHIAWGAAKAVAITRPAVALLSRDLMDGSRVESAVSAAGYRLEVWRRAPEDAEEVRRPTVVFVDLTHPDADRVIRGASQGARVVAFGPHVDDLAMVRATALGATEAVPRSRFFRSVGAWLPQIV